MEEPLEHSVPARVAEPVPSTIRVTPKGSRSRACSHLGWSASRAAAPLRVRVDSDTGARHHTPRDGHPPRHAARVRRLRKRIGRLRNGNAARAPAQEACAARAKCRERTAGSTAAATLPQRTALGGTGKLVTGIRPWDGRISDEPRADGTICNETRRRAHAKDCRPPRSGGLPTHGLASEAGTRGTLAPHRVDASGATSQRETQCLSPRLYRVPGASSGPAGLRPCCRGRGPQRSVQHAPLHS